MTAQNEIKGDSWLGLGERVCVVTGAAGGIGSEISRHLAAVGAHVALLDLDEAGCKRNAAEIEGTGGRAIGLHCDVSDPESVIAAAHICEEVFGPCRVLVNNAATFMPGRLIDVTVAQWDEVMGVNARGYLLCAQAFAKQMIPNGGGSLIHVSSIGGVIPQPYTGMYSASKAAVMMLSKLLAIELGEYGIRSNVVLPAMIRTPASEKFYTDPAILRRRSEIAPLKRIGKTSDIAEAILFFASDRSSYVSGEEMLVDGGLAHIALSMIPRPGLDRQDHVKA